MLRAHEKVRNIVGGADLLWDNKALHKVFNSFLNLAADSPLNTPISMIDMFDNESGSVKVAILDLYDGHPNQGMRCFQDVLTRYSEEHHLNLSYEIFEVRKENKVPGTEFDIYISSGGPGSPLESEGSDWEKSYFDLIERIDHHNRSNRPDKKYVLFVCHSFQLMCR